MDYTNPFGRPSAAVSGEEDNNMDDNINNMDDNLNIFYDNMELDGDDGFQFEFSTMQELPQQELPQQQQPESLGPAPIQERSSFALLNAPTTTTTPMVTLPALPSPPVQERSSFALLNTPTTTTTTTPMVTLPALPMPPPPTRTPSVSEKLLPLVQRILNVSFMYASSVYAQQPCVVTDLDSIVDCIRRFGFACVKVPIIPDILSTLQSCVTSKLDEYRAGLLLPYMNLKPSGQLLDLAMQADYGVHKKTESSAPHPCMYNSIMSGSYHWDHILFSNIPLIRQIVQRAETKYADAKYAWLANLQSLFFNPPDRKLYVPIAKDSAAARTLIPPTQGGDIGSTCYFSPYAFEWYHLQQAKESNKQLHLSEWEHLQFFMPIQPTADKSHSNYFHIIPGFQHIFDDLMTMICNNEIDNTDTADSLTDTITRSTTTNTQTPKNSPLYGNTYYRLSPHLYQMFKSFKIDINFRLPTTPENDNYNQIIILDPRMGLSFSMVTDNALILPFSIWPVDTAANAAKPPAQISKIQQIRTMEYNHKIMIFPKEQNLKQNILYSTLRTAHFLDTTLTIRKKNSSNISDTINKELQNKYGPQGGPQRDYRINGFPGSYTLEAADLTLQYAIKKFMETRFAHLNVNVNIDEFGTALNSTLQKLSTLTLDYPQQDVVNLQYVATPPLCSQCGSLQMAMMEATSFTEEEEANASVQAVKQPALICLSCFWSSIK